MAYTPSLKTNSRIDVADILRGIAIGGIVLIHFIDHRRLQHAVDREYQKIYKRYGDEEDTMLTAEQLEKIVLVYETALQKGEDPPKNID